MFEIEGKYAMATVFAEEVEESCIAQITKMTNHPAFTVPDGEHIAIMPDTHAGMGSVIGFTMKLGERIVPNIVGVDIGCGMSGHAFTPHNLPELSQLDKLIRNKVPMGFCTREDSQGHRHAHLSLHNAFFADANDTAVRMHQGLFQRFGSSVPNPPRYSLDWFEDKCKQVGCDFGRAKRSIGTLGGGNHFIELGKSTEGNAYWLVVHSGSRNFGLKICKYWQKLATQRRKEKLTGEYEAEIRNIRENTSPKSAIPKKIKAFRKSVGLHDMKGNELDYLEGDDMYGYLWDMVFAQQYAILNRYEIMSDCFMALGITSYEINDRLETTHNYIDTRDLTIRKGAISSYKGERMILPFNMRDGTLICSGKSNEEWLCSAPHGAGRVMSRTEAKKRLQASEAREQMTGIYTSVIPLDEAPGAYKSATIIEEALAPTAEIIERVKPVLNIKAE